MLDGRFPTYRLMQETVVGYMRDNYLVWDSLEERSTPLAEVLGAVKAKMESSPAAFQFVPQERFLRGHEGLGLTLLEHINRGHLSNNQSALRATSYRANTTIDNLLQDKTRFAVAAHHLGFYECSFVINTGTSLPIQDANLLTELMSIHSCFAIPAQGVIERKRACMPGTVLLRCLFQRQLAISRKLR